MSMGISTHYHAAQAILTQQLAAFGLNPREWRVAKDTSHGRGILHFEHKEDGSFRLLANVARSEATGLKVHSLQLASL